MSAPRPLPVLALLLGWGAASLLAQAAPVRGPGVIVLRGTLAPRASVELAFVADRETLGSARLSGVNGAELMSYRGERLLQQAEFYRQAQLAAGRPATEVPPLFIILDPAGTWAYAHSIARFRYTRGGRSFGPYQTPALVLGEGRAYEAESQPVTAESAAANRTLLERLRPWYATAAAAAKPPWRVRGTPDVDQDVLKRYKLTTGDNLSFDLVAAAEALSTPTYLQWVGEAVVEDLTTRGLDGKALWERFSAEAGLAALAEQGRQASLKQRVSETVAHEMGHVIQFAAQGPGGLAPDEHLPHMDGGSHALDTLSSPAFALTEGFAIANSMVVTGTPRPARPGAFNRIDYAATQAVILKKLNTGRARAVADQLVKSGRMPADQALTVPPFNTPRAEFDRDLEAAARARGMTDAEWAATRDRIAADPELAHLERVRAYVDGLQAKKGQKRARYDFLRSEYAVAGTLAGLRERLGPEKSGLVLRTMAVRKPHTLADLVEGFVHDQPALKGEVYAILAEVTEGILVTPAQAAWVAAEAAAGRSVEIDLDRDGRVPGTLARPADPALFPPEPSPFPAVTDPLRWNGTPSRFLAADLGGGGEPHVHRGAFVGPGSAPSAHCARCQAPGARDEAFSAGEPRILGPSDAVPRATVTAPAAQGAAAAGEEPARIPPPPGGDPGLDDLILR